MIGARRRRAGPRPWRASGVASANARRVRGARGTLRVREGRESAPVPPPAQDGPHRARAFALARWGAVLLLSGFLVLAHGCHGDEDNELFARARDMLTLVTE
jgi:hypothetical protein